MKVKKGINAPLYTQWLSVWSSQQRSEFSALYSNGVVWRDYNCYKSDSSQLQIWIRMFEEGSLCRKRNEGSWVYTWAEVQSDPWFYRKTQARLRGSHGGQTPFQSHVTCTQDVSEDEFQVCLTISAAEALSHDKEKPGVSQEHTDSPKSLGLGMRPEEASGLGQRSGLWTALLLCLGWITTIFSLPRHDKGWQSRACAEGPAPLTQCREPMHSLAARRGMVASSGFRRMHSFSTFTARADLAKGDHFCETQDCWQKQTLKPSQRGFRLGYPLNEVFQHRAQPRRGLGMAATRAWNSWWDRGVNCG